VDTVEDRGGGAVEHGSALIYRRLKPLFAAFARHPRGTPNITFAEFFHEDEKKSPLKQD
jgi:hypothetical protein